MIAASLVLFALLAGMAGTTFGLVRAEQRRHDAEQAQAEEARQRHLAEEAAAAETAALAQTRRRLVQIEKGVDLLASMLHGINPRTEEKRGPTLYEQLRARASKAADQLDAESVGDPQAVARLQTILGETLRELGDSSKAIAVLEKACATRERELGDDDPDTLTSRNYLANAYKDAGKLDLAIPLYERTLKSQEAKLGDDHAVTLIVRDNLAVAYQDAGKLDLAIPLFVRTLKAFEAKLGDDNADTLISRSNLAGAYQAAGKLDLAIPLHERTLKICEAKLGDDHLSTLTSRGNLATAYWAAGKLDLAIPLLERTLKAFEAKLGDDHPSTMLIRNNLANAYMDAKKQNLAIPLYERNLRASETKLGDDHPNTLLTRANLAAAYRETGRLEEAIALYEKAALSTEKRQFRSEYARRAITDTIAAYEAAKQFDKAEAWQRKWLAFILTQAGAESPAYAGELAALGLSLLKQRKWSDAEAPLRECLAIREKTQPDAWTTFNTQSMLGGALLGQKTYADAEPLLLAGYEGMKQREKTIPPQGKVRLPEAIERLVQLYEALDKKDDAAKWRKELEAIKAAERKPEGKP